MPFEMKLFIYNYVHVYTVSEYINMTEFSLYFGHRSWFIAYSNENARNKKVRDVQNHLE